MRQIRTIVVHCTATSQSTRIDSIQRYWREQMKWRSPGYHLIIEGNGSVTRLAPDSAVTNGVAGHNANSLHVAYIGGIDSLGRPLDNRTQAQKEALLRVIKEWKRLYPGAVIRGHRDFANKACPSFPAKEEYASI
jgi:N-acetylmuramoyl-L-alanine amidase